MKKKTRIQKNRHTISFNAVELAYLVNEFNHKDPAESNLLIKFSNAYKALCRKQCKKS